MMDDVFRNTSSQKSSKASFEDIGCLKRKTYVQMFFFYRLGLV